MTKLHKTRWILLLLLILIVILTAGCGGTQMPDSGTDQPAQDGGDVATGGDNEDDPVQDMDKGIYQFTATDLGGNTISQDIFSKADLTMINVWGTFCGPCLEEMPGLGEINRESLTVDGKKFQIIGIVIDTLDDELNIDAGQVELAKEIVAQTKADYLHILPSSDLINAKLQYVTAIPDTMFVDRYGNYVGEEYLGSKSKEEWISIIESNLKQVQ